MGFREIEQAVLTGSVGAASDAAAAALQATQLIGEVIDLQKGISWPGGGVPVPQSRWTVTAVPATANTLATVTKASPGPGKFLVVTQVVFTMANSALTTAATKAGLLTDQDGNRLFGGILGVQALIGASAVIKSVVPLDAPPDKSVTAAFGSAGGAGVYEAVAMAGYVAEV